VSRRARAWAKSDVPAEDDSSLSSQLKLLDGPMLSEESSKISRCQSSRRTMGIWQSGKRCSGISHRLRRQLFTRRLSRLRHFAMG
jgi:hypothetical protein